jgi:hypothetical protein
VHNDVGVVLLVILVTATLTVGIDFVSETDSARPPCSEIPVSLSCNFVIHFNIIKHYNIFNIPEG